MTQCAGLQLEDLIARDLQLARQLVTQKKQSQALIALKKKKIQEGRVDSIDKWLINVESTVRSCYSLVSAMLGPVLCAQRISNSTRTEGGCHESFTKRCRAELTHDNMR